MTAVAILRRPEVERLAGVSRSTIYRWMAAGQFPTPVRLGVRARGWRTTDVEAWLASRARVSYDDRAASKRSA